MEEKRPKTEKLKRKEICLLMSSVKTDHEGQIHNKL